MFVHHELYADECRRFQAEAPDALIADVGSWPHFTEPFHDWRRMDLGPDEPTSWHCPWCGRVQKQESRPAFGVCFDRRDNQETPPCDVCISAEQAARRAGACAGGCGHFGDCRCYGLAYARGKDKAHWEVCHTRDGHPADCGCEPCKTARVVIAGYRRDQANTDVGRQRAYDAAYWAARITLGNVAATRPDAERTDVARAIAEDVAADAGNRADLGRAAGTAVAAAFRMAANWTAQADGTADAFGLDAADRRQSWSGRYDGAA